MLAESIVQTADCVICKFYIDISEIYEMGILGVDFTIRCDNLEHLNIHRSRHLLNTVKMANQSTTEII